MGLEKLEDPIFFFWKRDVMKEDYHHVPPCGDVEILENEQDFFDNKFFQIYLIKTKYFFCCLINQSKTEENKKRYILAYRQNLNHFAFFLNPWKVFLPIDLDKLLLVEWKLVFDFLERQRNLHP